ncbi:F-box/LRR-repeat protein 6-like isoform X2 [Agrilus planipennis]|uniref:F-box/LRR-repeat protein 6-like isoform X2 n=1 Tax=Agrilus planipennis TaxID=224129 RepID=A0A7F5RHU2_AGRPL|nr:F-box/LRR-repeat protein 6-like isoform X2 [Agrilus planipennis]
MAQASIEREKEALLDVYPKTRLNCESQVNHDKNSCVDTNGDLEYSDYKSLPNNNVCSTTELSQCHSKEMASDTPLSEQHSEASSSNTPSQESDTRSVYSPGSEVPFMSDDQESELCFPPNCSDGPPSLGDKQVSNGVFAVKSKRNKVTRSSGERKKVKMGSTSARGRPRKTFVTMYHSQISGDKDTIKIRIKKSNAITHVKLPSKKKSGRRKKHKTTSDTDASDHETSRKRSRLSQEIEADLVTSTQEPLEQSTWGKDMPEELLTRIFKDVCHSDGCLPALVRLCQVCRLWQRVALIPTLWQTIDLNWVKNKFRTDHKLHWLIQNRLSHCEDLNLGEWRVRDVQNVILSLSRNCPQLVSLNLSGWKGLMADHFKLLSSEFPKLQRLDLSSISGSSLNSQPLVHLAQTMGNRLTHLVLAHNKLIGFTLIMTALSECCSNLQLLDISNIRTFSHNTALLRVERLQNGCPKLRVLRITNSEIWLAPASIPEQMSSPGFPNLEELSLAGLEAQQATARTIDNDGIERILKNSTKLRLLDVRGCIRLTDSGLVKVPAWDLEHLFLSACYVTRTTNSGLELILQKWSHSLLEVDLAWSTATESLDAAVLALAEKGDDSPLRVLNLCGSSVSLDPVKAVLTKCPQLHSINLQSCRALPRGIKRLYTGRAAVAELRRSLQDKPKTETDDEESSGAGRGRGATNNDDESATGGVITGATGDQLVTEQHMPITSTHMPSSLYPTSAE